MANVYNTAQTSITSTGTFVTVFTASASTTLVKAVRIVHDSGASTATLAITKSGGTQTSMGEFSLSSKTLTSTIAEVLPLEAGDVLKVSCTHQPTRVWVSYVENVASVAGQSIDVLTDVDTTGKADGDVLTYNSTTGEWGAEAPGAAGVTSVSGFAPIDSTGGSTPVISISAADGTAAGSMSAAHYTKLEGIAAGAEVNQNAFSNIAVTGQTPVAADGKTDTLNLAPSNANTTITTDAGTDTVTIGIANDVLLTSVSTTGNIAAFGNVSGANLSTGGNINASGTLTVGTAIVQTLSFTGGGTTTIGPDNSLPTDPSDLLIRTNGNVDVVLDYDNDETSQAFRVKDGAGAVMFSVDEDGISVANGTASTGAVLRLGEATANGTNYVALQSPAALAGSTTYTMPTADGTSGQLLSTNGAGALSWATGGAVTSVNTQTGAVVLTTSNIAEGTNLYFTNARADARTFAEKDQILQGQRNVDLNGDGVEFHATGPVIFGIDTSGIYATGIILFNGLYYPTANGVAGQSITTDGTATLTMGHPYSQVTTKSATAITLAISDAGKYIRCTGATAITVTIPQNVFSVGHEILLEQNTSTAQVTIAAGAGVTLRNSGNFLLKTSEQYSIIGLKCVAANEFILTGEREIA